MHLLILMLFAAPSTGIEVVASNALNGQVAANRCENRGKALAVRLAEQMSQTHALRIDAGDLLGTSTLGRLAIEDDPAAFATAIESLGISAASLGHRDLAAPRKRLEQFLRATRIPFTLTNLSCDDGSDQSLCSLVTNAGEPAQLIDTPYGKVAFVSAVSPTALEHAARDRTQGIQLLNPAEALSDATRIARQAGAEWVIAAYDPELGRELDDAIAQTLKLDPTATPDIMFVSGIADQVKQAITSVASTLIVAVRPDQAIGVKVQGSDEEVTVAPRGEAPAKLVDYAERLNRKLCERLGQPLPGGLLTQPLGRADFADFVLAVMRERASADIGILNQLSVSSRAPYPFSDYLTPLGLMQALPFENELRVAELRGDELAKFMAASKLFYVQGLRATPDGIFVNGRPLDASSMYRVATIDFVAEGGHGAFNTEQQQRFHPLQPQRTLRDTMLQWLSEKRAAPVDPSERTRWTLLYKGQLDLTNVTVANPRRDIFLDTQLARGQALSLVGEAEFRAFGDHPAWTLENQVRLRYGLARTIAADGTDSGAINNVDLLVGRTLVYYRRLFAQKPHWYEPRPYADLYIESELTKPTNRPYHHLQLLPTAGLRFEITRTLAFYGGVGVTWETLASRAQLTPRQDPAAFVIVAGWQLRPTKLAKLGERSVEMETNLDVFIRDIGAQTQTQLRGRVRILIPVFSVLAITTTYDVYMRYLRFQEESGTYTPYLGFAGDVYVGLQLTFSQARQAFLF